MLVDKEMTQFVGDGETRPRGANWLPSGGVTVDVKRVVLTFEQPVKGVSIVPTGQACLDRIGNPVEKNLPFLGIGLPNVFSQFRDERMPFRWEFNERHCSSLFVL